VAVARVLHGIVVFDTLFAKVDDRTDPVHVANVDRDEKLVQGKDINLHALGPALDSGVAILRELLVKESVHANQLPAFSLGPRVDHLDVEADNVVV
jgi:hypothetical protein